MLGCNTTQKPAIWVPYREAGIDSNAAQFLNLLNLQKEKANTLQGQHPASQLFKSIIKKEILTRSF